MSLPSAYDAKQYEDDIYKKWEASGAFTADAESEKPSFTIAMPPPNATGVLHLGHAVMLALEDILIRHRRMKGYEALWVPGTDHAAIATENVVIRKIREEEGLKDPRSLGRDKLIDRIKEFVAGSQDTIRGQVRKMGASCDWTRERYTMDESLNRVVNEIFVRMYKDGLIYRGHRIVNWDPNLQTNVSDDEVERLEEKTPFYTFQYGPFEISTARPETKFGDKYVVMHPEDERYKDWKHGDTFECEWIFGKITATVIKDKAVDPEFGTGCMTITPWHDATDFEIMQRHPEIEPEQVIDFDGKLLKVAGEFAGMTIKEARPLLVEKLKEKGLLISVDENYAHSLAINSRGKGVIEPQIKEQWFIDVNKKVVDWKGIKMSLKEVMQDVVNAGDINIIPERFEKIYFHWIDNLRDWCISRQIWWGHRIPVWYKEGEESSDMHVGTMAPEGDDWTQDPDTLDTWFSSALWTWSTLIDPEKAQDPNLSLEELFNQSPDFIKFHPTQVMETGYDIIFFWVARMILMTTYATKEIPFDTVYLHGLIRTREGKKMSKSDPKTCIDPLDMIDQYGADALRMSMVIGNTAGNDMRLYEEKIKGYRNFTNKLWNASRFVLGIFEEKGIQENLEVNPDTLTAYDEWILGKLNQTIQEVDNDLTEFRISDAGQKMYSFLWDDFCDWYLELSKGDNQNPAVLQHVLKNILILLHPFIPFVTEQIWTEMPGTEGMLIKTDYPEVSDVNYNTESAAIVIDIISSIRKMRAENNIEPAKKAPVTIFAGSHVDTIQAAEGEILRMARVDKLTVEKSGDKPEKAAADIVQGLEIYIPLEGLVDLGAEKARLQKEVDNLTGYITGLDKKLSNKKFVENAPEQIVKDEKGRLSEAQEKVAKLKEQLESL